jgi:DNA-directed RNA polymerase
MKKEEKTLKEITSLSNVVKLGPIGTKVLRALEERLDYLKKNTISKPFEVVKLIERYKIDLKIVVQLSHIMIATGSQEGQSATSIQRALGDKVQRYYRMPNNSVNAHHLGLFITNAYAIAGLIDQKHVFEKTNYGNKTITTIKVYCRNRTELVKILEEFHETYDRMKPLKEPAKEWTSGVGKDIYGSDLQIVKNGKLELLKSINNTDTPLFLKAINAKQKIAFKVCQDTFNIYQWALDNNENAFEFNSNPSISIDRKNAKKLEAEFIRVAAKEQKSKFFQRYTADARGRMYPEAGFLNELCSDNARGLIQFFEGKPLGKTGKDQFFHHIANMFGEDKLPHDGRVKFVQDNYKTFCEYGYNPKVNKGWMNAAEVWQFLQACIELSKLDAWIKNGNKEEDFISNVICYRDGSNNGMQWLFSLAKDDKNAHLVNIKQSSDGKPGDFYRHIANSVIKHIQNMPVAEEEKVNFFTVWMKLNSLRNKTVRTSNKMYELSNLKTKSKKVKYRIAQLERILEQRNVQLSKFQKENRQALKNTDVVYWQNAHKVGGFDEKIWRQIVKRPSMTYGYSATKQGMGQQIIDDTQDINNKYLANKQFSAARLLGSVIYEAIEKEFPNVKNIMDFFKDNCRAYMEKTGKQYRHRTVISNFPLEQKYVKFKTIIFKAHSMLITEKTGEKVWHEGVKLNIKQETPRLDIKASTNGIAPNTIHNLDALHLMLVIANCKFDIVSAHDSYGAHACDIIEMQKVIREQFLFIVKADPIKHILDQTGNLLQYPQVGTLDPKTILDSEYAFA